MRVVARNRALAAAVSLGYLLGYLLVFVHFVAEQHAVCVEHGGTHHVEASSAPHSLADGLSELPAQTDDHCHLLNAVRHETTTAPPLQVSLLRPLPKLSTKAVDLPSATIRVDGAVWRYAPKQSPPPHS